MNFLLAFAIYTVITLWVGIGEIGPAKIGSVEPGTPADSIGLMPGDLIVNVDGDTIPGWEVLSGYIHNRPGEEVFISWQREGEIFSSYVIPQEFEGISSGEKVKVGLIGIGPHLERRPAGFLEAIANGAESTYHACSATVMGLYMLVTGEAGIKDFTGPVGIAEFTGRAMRSGALVFFSVIAFISANIGLLNILPIPVLDGGHVIFITIEAIIRKPISTKVKLIIQQVGMALLLALILIISYNDIMRLFVQK
jgi:regulator of sigma E protease